MRARRPAKQAMRTIAALLIAATAWSTGAPAQTVDEMAAHLQEDTKRLAELIKLTNIKVE